MVVVQPALRHDKLMVLVVESDELIGGMREQRKTHRIRRRNARDVHRIYRHMMSVGGKGIGNDGESVGGLGVKRHRCAERQSAKKKPKPVHLAILTDERGVRKDKLSIFSVNRLLRASCLGWRSRPRMNNTRIGVRFAH
jgi:hypothetical protein